MLGYKEPKNTYEIAMNEIYTAAEQFINNRTYAGLDPIVSNLETIYKSIPYDLQMELSDYFYQLLCLTDNESGVEDGMEE